MRTPSALLAPGWTSRWPADALRVAESSGRHPARLATVDEMSDRKAAVAILAAAALCPANDAGAPRGRLLSGAAATAHWRGARPIDSGRVARGRTRGSATGANWLVERWAEMGLAGSYGRGQGSITCIHGCIQLYSRVHAHRKQPHKQPHEQPAQRAIRLCPIPA